MLLDDERATELEENECVMELDEISFEELDTETGLELGIESEELETAVEES